MPKQYQTMFDEPPAQMNVGQQPNVYDTYYTGVQQQQKADLTRWQLDPRDILEEIEHKLKGEIVMGVDAEGNDIYGKKGEPLMNDEGINAIITLISARISKVIILSNLTEEDISKIMIAFSNELISLFFMKYKEFQIDEAYMSSITNYIEDIVYATLNRALKGGERDFLKTTERRIESYSDKPEQKGMSNMFGIFRK
jgi:hypothetical protein